MKRLDGDILDRARSWLLPERGLFGGTATLVALSGGADSLALALALFALKEELGIPFVAAGHVDHGLRKESADEAERVRAWALERGIPFFSERLDPPARAPGGREAWAREARYAALSRLRRAARCGTVATAHHRGDQAETVAMRLLRGTGAGGLAGILRSDPRRNLVRPFLDRDPGELRAWLRDLGEPWIEDPSNADQRFARNAVRHRILPAWEAREPGVSDLLAKIASEAGALLPGLRAWARETYPFRKAAGRFVAEIDPDDVALDDGTLLRLSCDEVFAALSLAPPDARRWERLMRKVRAGQRFCEQLPGGNFVRFGARAAGGSVRFLLSFGPDAPGPPGLNK